MRIRRFLIVHSSRSIRAMVQRHILADLDDVEIAESTNGKDALLQLTHMPFDLVICDCDLTDMTITDFRHELDEIASKNKPMEILALAGGKKDAAHLARMKFEHFIELPFKPEVLVAKINQICNPRKWRKTERFHIPKAKVVINVWDMEAEATMINVSRGGVLVEVSGDRSDLLLQNDPKLTLKINVLGCNYLLKALPVKLARLNVVKWNEHYKPILMRLAYIFLDQHHDIQSELTHILKLAEEDGLFANEAQRE